MRKQANEKNRGIQKGYASRKVFMLQDMRDGSTSSCVLREVSLDRFERRQKDIMRMPMMKW